MTLLAMDFKSISTAPWWATKYSFTSLTTVNRTEVSSFFRARNNKAPPLILPIGGAALPHLNIWKQGWSGINLPRSSSVGGSSPLLFDRINNQLMN